MERLEVENNTMDYCGKLQDLSVVVLSCNRKDELSHNLPALCEASKQTGFELIVVDNASTDGSKEILAQLAKEYPGVRVIINDTNLGVAGGRNCGWQMASGCFILNIDDDTRLGIDNVLAMRQLLIDHPEVGIVSPKIVHAATGTPQYDFGETFYHPANFHGACHMVKTEVFKKVGTLDPNCSFGGEEFDYSIRSRSKGYEILYTPSITVSHNNLKRAGINGIRRRRKWLYNYTRVLFKHFLPTTAFLCSVRYCFSHIVSGIKHYNPLFALSLPFYALFGAINGRKQHLPIPREVELFYSNRELRPEFGNVPISSKLLMYVKQDIWSFTKGQ